MAEFFDPRISLGNLLQLVVLLIALGAGWGRLSSRLAVLETRVEAMWKSWVRRTATGGHEDDTYGG